MVLTQIYLTQEERDGLKAAAQATGRDETELIHEALSQWLAADRDARRKAALEAAFGMWRDRDDLPDFEELRRSWDRDER